MVLRALHPIVLAGALLGLPAVAAWAPSRAGKVAATPVSVEVRNGATRKVEPEIAPPDGAILMPVEVVDAGSVPVRRYVQIQNVPEPSTLMLLLPATLLVLRRRR